MLRIVIVTATFDPKQLRRIAPALTAALEVTVWVRGVRADDPTAGREITTLNVEEIFTRLIVDTPLDLDMMIRFDEDNDVYRVDRLVVQSMPDSPGVTGYFLRNLPIQRLMQLGTASAVTIEEHYRPETIAADSPDELATARKRGPSDRILWSVACVYRAADIRDATPAADVADAFAIQSRTASNWIRRARERGMLETMAPEV